MRDFQNKSYLGVQWDLRKIQQYEWRWYLILNMQGFQQKLNEQEEEGSRGWHSVSMPQFEYGSC